MDAQSTTAGPDPTRVTDLNDLVRELNLLRSRAARGTRSARVSLEELASRVGEPKSTIHAYLTGKRLAPAELLDRLVIELGTTAAEQREWAEAWYRVCAHREARHRASRPEQACIVPRQLPPTVEHFTGRLAELAELDGLLGSGGGIATLVGPPGVGTTALAVHWAQARCDHYPDGQLYVDLRGFDPDPPLQPEQVLARFLRALGSPAADLPPDCAEQAAHFRSLLAGRRMLVLLDNARDSEQVRELLPGTASCAVLVTSRQRLAGLVARHGAHQIAVSGLPADEAVQLLRLLADPVPIDEHSAAQLAAQCSGLPLALRLTGQLLRQRPAPAELVAEFTGGANRLDLLAADDDPRTAIRAVFGWSYQRLAAPAARAFRLIGRYPAPELTPHTVTALLGSSLPEAQRLLGVLADAHLVRQSRPGCYRMPELLRLYAAELGAGEHAVGEPDAEELDAVPRAVDYYLHTAAQAVELVSAERQLRRVDPAAQVPDPDTARRWLAAESANLLAVVSHVCQGDWPWQTVRLARAVAGYLAPAEQPAAAARLLAPAEQRPAAELRVPAEQRPPAELGANA